MKKFVVALYDAHEDLIDLFQMKSSTDVIAVVRAVKRKDRDAYNAYIQWLDERDMDLGSLGDVKGFFHSWMSIAVKEVE